MTVLRQPSRRSCAITSSTRSRFCARVSAGSLSSAVYMSICSTLSTWPHNRLCDEAQYGHSTALEEEE